MPAATIIDVGAAKGQLYQGQPSTAWGEETEISLRCVEADGQPASHWYEIFRDYQRHAGADAFGRLEDGDPWVHDSSRADWPVDSNVVQIVAGSQYQDFEDVWALITEIEDESEIPFVYRFTVTFVPLAFASDYADRGALLTDLASPSIQL